MDKINKVDDEVQIQALVDGKRVNFKKSSIRCTLRLDDAEGTSFLTNAKIFEGLDGIEKLESTVERLEEENRVLKELMGVHSKVDSNEPVMEKEESSKQGRKIADIDVDVKINLEKVQAKAYNLDLDHQEKVQEKDNGKAILIEEPKPLKREVQIKLGEEVARQLEAELNADNMAGYKMNYFKGITYDEIRSLFEKHYNYNQAFLNEVNEEVKVPEREVRQEKEVEVESYKREGESLKKEVAKKQKMEQETEELKKCLQIVPDDDDDVYADATPLASKIPIINYKIHTERNKPYFKIIRTDGNHMLFLSFSTMLKYFDREDLESLWKIIREIFEKIEPKNFLDDYLLNTLKIMFENLNVKDNVWKDQKGKYGLAKMVNDVRLQLDDESEMYLELLRLVRIHLIKGYKTQ
nr:hypothetical protein [Tanacetum cinerariifolium]